MLRSAARLLCLAALAAMVAACASTGGPGAPSRPADRPGMAAALSHLLAVMEASFADGRSYTMTELRGMTNAQAMGEEGRDAAALWDAEIQHHYRSHRPGMQAALEAELRGYADVQLARILEAPDARFFFLSETYRAARTDAICAAMASTPVAWTARYPQRAPFTFARFGIDEPLIMRWCAALDQKLIAPRAR